jgi:hypothetical protein
MGRTVWMMSLLFLLAGSTVMSSAGAQKKGPINLRRDPATTSAVPQTPEMWLYEQERDRYENPQQAVRRKAEFRAAQRQARLASQKWYGFTPARPSLSVTPWYGPPSPGWYGNGSHFNRWTTIWSFPEVVKYPRSPGIR